MYPTEGLFLVMPCFLFRHSFFFHSQTIQQRKISAAFKIQESYLCIDIVSQLFPLAVSINAIGAYIV